VPLFRRAWDWLLDLVTLAGLGVLDWLAPLQETPVDWASATKAGG
jgi:hypothetical protein